MIIKMINPMIAVIIHPQFVSPLLDDDDEEDDDEE